MDSIYPIGYNFQTANIRLFCVYRYIFICLSKVLKIDVASDGDDIDASRFAAGDKVAVQAWFGSYVFTNKSGKTISGPTFRLLKLWRLQAGSSTSSSLNSSPVTKRRRIL
jgi:hypothetical protein